MGSRRAYLRIGSLAAVVASLATTGKVTADALSELVIPFDDLSPGPTAVQFQQPLAPTLEAGTETPLSSAATGASQQLAAAPGSSGFEPVSFVLPSVDFSTRDQAFLRATADAGDLIGSLPSVTNTIPQRRNPIVTDPRVRGSRVGALAASGSHWVPARIDLDTMVSKLDSRIVESVAITPGPYSALNGPGFSFVDVELQRAPRSDGDFEIGGLTSLDYRTNGDQWNGRQSFAGGDSVWGFRAGYSHRTGSDYDSGDGTRVPASFNSRAFDGAVGAQLTEASNADYNYLRLDQTNVELAGQAFDIDWLVTDAHNVRYSHDKTAWSDRVDVEAWYNRTRFEGSAQNPSKRAQIPALVDLDFEGFTDVDSMSTGYRVSMVWDGDDGESLTAGTDLRYVKQELNELSSGRRGFFRWEDANSPIPRSHASNPGLFAQYDNLAGDGTAVHCGARVDWNSTNVEATAAELASVGILELPASDFLGTDQFDQDDLLGMAFLAIDHAIGDGWLLGGSVGYAERAPNLTERYAIESFMFVIQNGLNTVTGNPLLDKERLVQVDVRLAKGGEIASGSITAFHAWAEDYITYEATSVILFPPAEQREQLNLQYVNTDRARLWGVEAAGELQLTQHLVPFGTLSFVQGQDDTRNGSFSTTAANPGGPAMQTPGQPRGAEVIDEGITGTPSESLPGIPPLEARVGVRVEPAGVNSDWGLEISARIVDNQGRVATSLLESTTPGFTVWDLRGYWRPIEGLRLIAGIENFTDKNYREHLDFRLTRGDQVLRPGIGGYFGAESTY